MIAAQHRAARRSKSFAADARHRVRRGHPGRRPLLFRRDRTHRCGSSSQIVQRDDVTWSSPTRRPLRIGRSTLRDLPGVLRVEPFRAVPARLRFQHRTRRVELTGLPSARRTAAPRRRGLAPSPCRRRARADAQARRASRRRGGRPRCSVEVLEGARAGARAAGGGARRRAGRASAPTWTSTPCTPSCARSDALSGALPRRRSRARLPRSIARSSACRRSAASLCRDAVLASFDEISTGACAGHADQCRSSPA